MPKVPPGFAACLNDVRKALNGVDGFLSDREAQFLAMLAACPTCEGEIVEIGTYCGRSSIALAKGAALAGTQTVHTVDILPQATVENNLRNANVHEHVALFHMPSQEMLADWRRPVRLFWHDGPNNFDTVAKDLEQILPFLGDRAFVAFHDVLNTSGERIFVFTERVLENPHFGNVGTCGSIGWAQYRSDPTDAQAYSNIKRRLHSKLQRLYPFHENCIGRRQPWVKRAHYRLLRSLIPHGRVRPTKWINRVA